MDWLDFHIVKATLHAGGNLTPVGWEWFRRQALRWAYHLDSLWGL